MRTKGKIIGGERGYFVKAMVLYVLRRLNLRSPVQVTLSDKWSWTRHDCCICGTSFKPYVRTGTLNFPGPSMTDFTGRYPICDECIETECPDLYRELLAQRAKFDAELRSDARG